MRAIPALLGRRFQVDFVQARPPQAPLAWMMLAAGVLALGVALLDIAPRWLQRDQLRRERADLQARLDRMPGAPRPAARASDAAGFAQARSVLDELGRPWPALFDQFESVAVPEVHVLQLGVDANFHTVQVLAEAPKLEQVVRYSQLLPGNGPVRSVRLTHHEWRVVPIGRVVVANLTAELRTDGAVDKGVR